MATRESQFEEGDVKDYLVFVLGREGLRVGAEALEFVIEAFSDLSLALFLNDLVLLGHPDLVFAVDIFKLVADLGVELDVQILLVSHKDRCFEAEVD